MSYQNAILSDAETPNLVEVPLNQSTYKQDPVKQIYALLSSLFDASEANRWLYAPQDKLEGHSPMELIAHGDAARILHLVMRLDEGMHV